MSTRVRHRAVFLLLIAGLLGSLLVWAFLALWLPMKGRVWLEQALEAPGTLDVTVGRVRYDPWRGFQIHEIVGVDRTTGKPVFAALQVQGHVGLASWLFRGVLAVRLHGHLKIPCVTEVTAAGRYRPRTRRLHVDVRTSPWEVATAAAPLTDWLPEPLKSGRVELNLRIVSDSREGLNISGKAVGTALVWHGDPWRATADVTLSGTARPPQEGAPTWRMQVGGTIRRGSIEQIPFVGPITTVEGRFRLNDERLELVDMTGTALGSPWSLQGAVESFAKPAVEIYLRSPVNLEELRKDLPGIVPEWQFGGLLKTEAVCRGLATDASHLDCLARATLENATLSAPRLPEPITQLRGAIRYEHLTKTLTVDHLTGRLETTNLALQGDLAFVSPTALNLALSADGNLEVAREWLDPNGPIRTMAGAASLRLALRGAVMEPVWEGHLTVTDSRLSLRGMATPLTAVTGTIKATSGEIRTERLRVLLGEHPLELTGHLTRSEPPRLSGELRAPFGTVRLSSRLTPEALVIDSSDVLTEYSRLQLSGRISRSKDGASAVTAGGTIELSDLLTLPVPALKRLDEWKPAGPVALTGRWEGTLDQWRAASMRASLRADRITVRSLPVSQLVLELDQAQGRLNLKIPQATVAQGSVWSELLIALEPEASRYVLELDLTGIDLAEFALAMPPPKPQIDGRLSGHLRAGGVWQARDSWHGGGWLHANGERLADLPLLNRLMPGLFGVLADRLGLSTLKNARVTELSGQWQLIQERAVTDNLKLSAFAGTEPLTIYAKGSIGLDKTLDLVIEPELSEQLVLQAPNISTLGGTIVKTAGGIDWLRRRVGRHRLVGTIDKPQYKFEVSLEQLLQAVVGGGLERVFELFR